MSTKKIGVGVAWCFLRLHGAGSGAIAGVLPGLTPLAPDRFQPLLLRRYGFQRQVKRSVRLLEAAKSVQRACYTDLSCLCPV